MKKLMKTACMLACLLLVATTCVACNKNAEVAGTYSMTSISGTINGVQVNKSMYEYFDMILEKNGDVTVRSKGSAVGSPAYEAKGTYVYEDGKIKVTTKNNGASITEVYDYEDGVITYTINAQGMSFSITLEKVEK